jgi:RNA recognition motif-containing protein
LPNPHPTTKDPKVRPLNSRLDALRGVSNAMASGSVSTDGVFQNRQKMDIYVGNLPYTATEDDLTGLFAAYGPVERVKIITDRETGRSKGFAFVTLGDQSQLNAAIEALNGYDYQGRALRVNASEPKESKPGGFGGERRGGGGGGGYGGERRGGGGERRGGGGYKGGGGGYKGGGGGYKGGGGGGGGDW